MSTTQLQHCITHYEVFGNHQSQRAELHSWSSDLSKRPHTAWLWKGLQWSPSLLKWISFFRTDPKNHVNFQDSKQHHSYSEAMKLLNPWEFHPTFQEEWPQDLRGSTLGSRLNFKSESRQKSTPMSLSTEKTDLKRKWEWSCLTAANFYCWNPSFTTSPYHGLRAPSERRSSHRRQWEGMVLYWNCFCNSCEMYQTVSPLNCTPQQSSWKYTNAWV